MFGTKQLRPQCMTHFTAAHLKGQPICLTFHPGHLPNTVKQLEIIQNACDQPVETAFLAAGSVLC